MPLAINFASKLLAESYQAHSPVQDIGSTHQAHTTGRARDFASARSGSRPEAHQTALAGAAHNATNWINDGHEQRRNVGRQLAS